MNITPAPHISMVSNETQAHVTLTAQSPWPGLAAYDERASDFFFGRKEEAAELARMIRLAPLTVLYGKSGLGKTSLLQAGLYPLLRAEHYFPVHLRLDFSSSAMLAPLDQAMQKLLQAFAGASVEFSPAAAGESLWHYLHRRDLEIWNQDNYPLTPVLIFDQFEEIFSQGEWNPERIQPSLNALADLIENRIPDEFIAGDNSRYALSELDVRAQRYRIVLSFREDFLAEIEGWKEQVPSLLRNRLRLLPMSRERAIQAVTSAGSAVLAAGVAEPLVDFVGNLDSSTASILPVIEPVLLSLCCYQLNQRRSPGSKIDIDLLHQAGQDILQDFYHEALAGMPATVSEFIETYLIQGNRYRSSYPVDQALQDEFLTREQLSLLASKHRLLRIDQQLGVNRIELIHDRLVTVVSKARDERLRQAELQRLRIEEEARRRQMALANALEKQVAAEALAEERLRATERAQADATRLRKQTRQLQGALLGVIILAGVAGYGLYDAHSEKKVRKLAQREAISLRLVSESLDISSGVRPGGDERAILQLLAAQQLSPGNKKVDSALITTLSRKYTTQKIWSVGSKINAIAFSPDGTRLVSADSDGMLQEWDINTGQPIGDRLPGVMEGVSNVVTSPNGQISVLSSQDNALRLLNASTGQPIGEPLRGHEGKIVSVAFSPDGKRIASASRDATVRLWAVRDIQLIDAPLQGHEDMVASVVFSPDGTRILSASDDKTLRLWHADTGQPIGEPMRGHEGALNGAVFSPDGTRIVSAASDETLRLWDANTRQPIGEPLQGHKEGVESVAFSPDGAWIASGGKDSMVRVWDAHTGQLLGEPLRRHQKMVRSVAFSPDSVSIVSGSYDHTLQRWDVKTGQPIDEPMTGHTGPVVNVAYSPNGQYIVSGSKDRTVRLWNAHTGQLIGEALQGHEERVNGVAFSPDSRRIVSGSHDMMLRLWDVERGLPLGGPLPGHVGAVLSVAFSPDGARIVSGSADKTLRLWPANTEWVAQLCSRLTRNMSPTEWRTWVSPDVKYRKQCANLPIPEDTAAAAESSPGDRESGS